MWSEDLIFNSPIEKLELLEYYYIIMFLQTKSYMVNNVKDYQGKCNLQPRPIHLVCTFGLTLKSHILWVLRRTLIEDIGFEYIWCNCSNTYNGPAGLDLDRALLNYPDVLATDSVMSFKSALWYWMNCHLEKPSCHSVMTNQWVPNSDDVQAGRVAGFGLTTNIIDGENECGLGYDERVAKRIGFYETFCDLIGVTYGENLDCYNQKPYGSSPVSKIYKAIYKIFME